MARVLVVDDEGDVRRLVRVTLEADGHQVTEAVDGVEALQVLTAQLHDLVVLDVNMPGLDGWGVLVTLKSSEVEALSTLPVVMLTGRRADVDRIRGGIEGAVRYVTKPFSPEALRHEVRLSVEVPEPVQRRRARLDAMAHLAVLEKDGPTGVRSREPQPRLTRLGPSVAPAAARPLVPRLTAAQRDALSPRQHELLRAVGSAPTIVAAAQQLNVSRSNVYASLRRISRRIGVASVPELVTLARREVADNAQ